jgi:hypothetical protein
MSAKDMGSFMPKIFIVDHYIRTHIDGIMFWGGLGIFFSSIVVWSQGLLLAKQVLYHLKHSARAL